MEQTRFFSTPGELAEALPALSDSYRVIRTLSKSLQGITIKLEEPMEPIFEKKDEKKEYLFLEKYRKAFGDVDLEKIMQSAYKELSLGQIYKMYQEDREFFNSLLNKFEEKKFTVDDVYFMANVQDKEFIDIFAPKMPKAEWNQVFTSKLLQSGNEYLVSSLACLWGTSFTGSQILIDFYHAGMKTFFFENLPKCTSFQDFLQNALMMPFTPEEAQKIVDIFPKNGAVESYVIRRTKLLRDSELAKCILRNADKMNLTSDAKKCL